MVGDCAEIHLGGASVAAVSNASTLMKIVQHEASKKQPIPRIIIDADCAVFSRTADAAFIFTMQWL